MPKVKQRSREPLTEVRIFAIIALIDAWSIQNTGQLTREALVRHVKDRLDLAYTRQGLMKRREIEAAFLRRQKELNQKVAALNDKEPAVVILQRQIEELKASLSEKDEVLARWKVMFLTYRYNARQLGITREQLNAPIPSRGQQEGSRG